MQPTEQLIEINPDRRWDITINAEQLQKSNHEKKFVNDRKKLESNLKKEIK